MPVSERASAHNDLVRAARKAVDALAASTCDCPYETERELAAEIERLRQGLSNIASACTDEHSASYALRVLAGTEGRHAG